MENTKSQQTKSNVEPSEIIYQVMPTLDANIPHEEVIHEPLKHQASPPPPGPIQPMHPLVVDPHNGGSKRWIFIGLGLVVLLLLGGGLYYFSTKKTEEPLQSTQSRLPKVWLSNHFGAEICTDESRCSESVDPDMDGLNNYDEFRNNTNPVRADTDNDGLADGDEVNIYKTEPTLKYTDRRDVAPLSGFTDGAQIKNDYDPLTPGSKLTETRQQQITSDIKKFGLHEPTKTTLSGSESTNAPPPTQTQNNSTTIFIEGTTFNPTSLNIKVGETIVWLNKDSKNHRVSSNPHPTHTGLPGFDSPDLTNNSTYSFEFSTVGIFGYHDHLNPGMTGTVEVK